MTAVSTAMSVMSGTRSLQQIRFDRQLIAGDLAQVEIQPLHRLHLVPGRALAVGLLWVANLVSSATTTTLGIQSVGELKLCSQNGQGCTNIDIGLKTRYRYRYIDIDIDIFRYISMSDIYRKYRKIS